MLNGIHFLLTYTCTYECDHCFLYCSPYSQGTFTIEQVEKVLREAVKLGSVQTIYFEGGEPFLYYPLLLESIKRAKQYGFQVGIVTNAYPVHSPEDALLWLSPLAELELDDLSISQDQFHAQDPENSPAAIAVAVAENLGLPVSVISIERPRVVQPDSQPSGKGKPIIAGDTMFRGRAADRLTKDLPLQKPEVFTDCPYENLAAPERVHLDAFGNVQVCQGISLGNYQQLSFSSLIRAYRVKDHPICRHLHEGGPFRLASATGVPLNTGYADACHFCFEIRKTLLSSYPDLLIPKQVYGLD